MRQWRDYYVMISFAPCWKNFMCSKRTDGILGQAFSHEKQQIMDMTEQLNWTELKEKSDIIYSWQEKGLGDSQVPNSRSSLSVLREKISCGMSCEENIVYSQRLSVPGLREVSTSCHQCKPGKLFPFHTPGPAQTRLSQWEHRSGYLNPLLFLNPCIQVLSHLYTS